MSQRPISRSPDLLQLRSEGYELEVRAGHLLVGNVPYVRPDRSVGRGILVMALNLAGEVARPPDTHVAYWYGEFPCNAQGVPMSEMGNPGESHPVDAELTAGHMFSRKPQPNRNYIDYHEKVVTLVGLLEGQARLVDPTASARSFRPARTSAGESVFQYAETASARAGISAATQKLEGGKVAIVGLGGTGSYVLDFVAKTPVSEIHLFDRDEFLTHNAFRAPGAPSLDELNRLPSKVARFASIYSNMHRGVISHEAFIDEGNLGELPGMEFVFLCLASGPAKRRVVEHLIANRIPFVDTGMGLYDHDNALGGIARATHVTSTKNDHVSTRIPMAEDEPGEYDRNIQIAEVNALNAALAVIRWKKDRGFYVDIGHENSSMYTIATNELDNTDAAD